MNRYLIPQPSKVAFSGGRTSGYLLYHIIQAYGGSLPQDITVCFANTGKEVEETLQFVRDCSVYWSVPIRWVEYCRDEMKPVVVWKGKQPLVGCHSFREVSFETASRAGEPFESLIDVKADYRREAKDKPPVLPNPVQRFCSGELKARTLDRFMKSIGFESFTTAVGLRRDEPERALRLTRSCTQTHKYVCPLYDAGVTEKEVLAFWKDQPFDLNLRSDPELGTYEGNCDLCFLKRTSKIKRLLEERPEAFDWWADMERKTGAKFRKDRPTYEEFASHRVSLTLCEDQDETVCMCTD